MDLHVLIFCISVFTIHVSTEGMEGGFELPCCTDWDCYIPDTYCDMSTPASVRTCPLQQPKKRDVSWGMEGGPEGTTPPNTEITTNQMVGTCMCSTPGQFIQSRNFKCEEVGFELPCCSVLDCYIPDTYCDMSTPASVRTCPLPQPKKREVPWGMEWGPEGTNPPNTEITTNQVVGTCMCSTPGQFIQSRNFKCEAPGGHGNTTNPTPRQCYELTCQGHRCIHERLNVLGLAAECSIPENGFCITTAETDGFIVRESSTCTNECVKEVTPTRTVTCCQEAYCNINGSAPFPIPGTITDPQQGGAGQIAFAKLTTPFLIVTLLNNL